MTEEEFYKALEKIFNEQPRIPILHAKWRGDDGKDYEAWKVEYNIVTGRKGLEEFIKNNKDERSEEILTK